MAGHATPTVDQQIARIPERFHEAHRRELPAIVALARNLEARCAPAGLAERLHAMGSKELVDSCCRRHLNV
jgi:iron-sulfur cluster repair protein YtfE (RIC family)